MLYGVIESLGFKNCPQSFSFALDFVSGKFSLFGQFFQPRASITAYNILRKYFILKSFTISTFEKDTSIFIKE